MQRLTNDVTLVLIDGVNPELSVKSLKKSFSQVNFEKVKLFSFRKPNNLVDYIEYVEIPKLSWVGYNNFITQELDKYIDTEFCLVTQTDGFITNVEMWEDIFLDYDYIGAPWPDTDVWLNLQLEDTRTYFKKNGLMSRVGNGGFSLRSKKFLSESSSHNCGETGEDVYLCVYKYGEMIKSGIKFPSVDLAIKFSIENPVREMGYIWPNYDLEFNTKKSFGFHGIYVKDYINVMRELNEQY